ncbi:DUF3570 domain-containing protein [Methylomonas sp. MgM2]
MAATKSRVLQALTASALALPGVALKVAAKPLNDNVLLDLQYGHYQESDGRVSVDLFQGFSTATLSESSQIAGAFTTDTWSGATPVLTMPYSVAEMTTGASGINGVNSRPVEDGQRAVQVMTGASMVETRYAFNLGYDFFVNDIGLHAQFSRSDEPDFLSYGYKLGADREFNSKMTTLSFGFGQNFDRVKPVTRDIKEDKSDYYLQTGITQILSKQTLLQISTEFMHGAGFLSNPYKKVFIQGLNSHTTLQNGGFDQVYYENRPDTRNQWSVSVGMVQYVSLLDASVHLDYRYFIDNWDISSHTFEAAYRQPLGSGWMLVPRLRYYSQTNAEFFQYYYSAPRADGFYSSDYRLANFGNLSGGLRLGREWQNVSRLAQNIIFEAGFEYTSHAADLKLGGQQGSDITDFDYILFNSTISIKF